MATPAERVAAGIRRWGEDELVTRCVNTLRGEWEPELALELGGVHGELVVTRDGPHDEYWTRVWAARAFLYVWSPKATEAIVDAVADDSWRVREMAWKVIAKRGIAAAGDHVGAAAADPVPRVRAAAARARRRLEQADG